MKIPSLTDTLSGKRETVNPIIPHEIKMYVCGVTPYDYAHLGHGRVYVTFDMLRRLSAFEGFSVKYCRNFTDIDDKLLNKARAEYGDPMRYKELADFYIKTFTHDMQQLGCLPPTYEPRVTEHIPQIIAFIDDLIKTGHAYRADGDVYFSIKTFEKYGKLSKRDLDDLIAGARVQPNEKKRDPLDFVLWKGEKEGTFWDSPWGWGRPGWHIECSALARHYLGDQIDIHGGGMDLIFPHHENEVAQTEAVTGKDFARLWMHIAFVRVNQEKMSKSLGNFWTLKDLLERFEPAVIRFLFVQHQYRNPLDFSLAELEEVRKSYQSLCRIFEGSAMHIEAGDLYRTVSEIHDIKPQAQEMLDFLCEDLNTPGMLGVVYKYADEIKKDAELKKQAKSILVNIVGLDLKPLPEKTVEMTPEIERLLAERERARAEKNWAQADALRDKLKSLGYEVRDTKAKK